MKHSAFNHRSGHKRVPFFPDTRRNSGSVNQIYHQISLPQNGTICKIFLSTGESISGVRSKRVAFCALKKASITVEAAIVVPLFLLAVISIISMMNAYGTTLEKAASLRDTAMTTALIVGSGEDEKIIDINLPFTFKPYFMPGTVMACRACVRAWNGRDEKASAEGKNSSGEYVYVTDNMSVYHTSARCTHLDLSIKAVPASSVFTRRNESGRIYHRCEKCSSGASEGLVYITDYGDCYHADSSCSGLKRTVRLVERSQVNEDLCCCSRCAAAA